MTQRMSAEEYRALSRIEKRAKAPLNQHEHNNQQAYFDILKVNERQFPFLKYIFAVPNAAKRSPQVAAAMMAEGLKAGVWDLHLPFQRRGYGGAWIENKYGENRLSTAQKDFEAHFKSENYFTRVCYTVDESLKWTEWYLEITLNK